MDYEGLRTLKKVDILKSTIAQTVCSLENEITPCEHICVIMNCDVSTPIEIAHVLKSRKLDGESESLSGIQRQERGGRRHRSRRLSR